MSNTNIAIAIVYTSKIPFFKEHFTSFLSTGVKQYNTDCFLVLGNEYNEDIMTYYMPEEFQQCIDMSSFPPKFE